MTSYNAPLTDNLAKGRDKESSKFLEGPRSSEIANRKGYSISGTAAGGTQAKSARVIVVGSGLSGLSAGFRLRERGFDVTVLEASSEIGGRTYAVRRDGFTLSTAVAFFAGSYAALFRLTRDIGMADEFIDVSPPVGVMRDGKVYYLRSAGLGALIDFARTKLISPWSKFLLGRFVLDVLKVRKNLVYDDAQARAKVDTESMGTYCGRRLNVELSEKLLAPLMGCLYLVDGMTLSAFDLHFGALKLLGPGLKAPRHGVDFITQEISKRVDVQTEAEVTLIEPIGNSVRVIWKKGVETYEERVAGVVSAVPAPIVPRIYPGLDPKIKTLLEKVGQWEYIVVRVALRERPDNDAGVVSVPMGELDGIAMILFEHNVSPGVAPPGKAVVAAYLYEPWAREHTDVADEEMISSVLASLEKVIPGISHLVEFTQVNRWPMGSPVLQHGAHKAIAELDALLDRRSRVQFAGDYLCTASTNGAVLSGELAAARLAATIESALDGSQVAVQ